MMIRHTESGLEVSVVRLPEPNEYILWRFDIDKYDLDEVEDIHILLQNEFPLNKVIGIPSDVEMKYLNKEEISNLIKNLEDYYKSMGQ